MLHPRKINIEPENDGLEDDFPFPGMHSQVPAVNLPGCSFQHFPGIKLPANPKPPHLFFCGTEDSPRIWCCSCGWCWLWLRDSGRGHNENAHFMASELRNEVCNEQKKLYIYIHIPGTQMTLVFVGISALFWGLGPFKNRGLLGVPGIGTFLPSYVGIVIVSIIKIPYLTWIW